MRLAFAFVRVGGGGFLVSWFLRVLLWNRFYFIVRKPTEHIHQYIIQI